MITREQLDELERYYAPADQQKCRVCGAPLTFSSSGEGRSRYNCSSDEASPVKNGVGSPGWLEGFDHYRNSAWIDRGQAHMPVVELIRLYRKLLDDGIAPALRELRDDIERSPMELVSVSGAVVMQRVLEAIDRRLKGSLAAP